MLVHFMLALFLLTSAIASPPALVPEVAAKQAVEQLTKTAKPMDFVGFTSYYANVTTCTMYLHAAVGLTVEDAGRMTLFVIVTMPSTRGHFTTLTIVDEEANGSIDMVNNVRIVDLNDVPYNAFTSVLGCSLRARP